MVLTKERQGVHGSGQDLLGVMAGDRLEGTDKCLNAVYVVKKPPEAIRPGKEQRS